MTKTHWAYMPILKWKQGERIALRNVPVARRDATLPLLELLPILATPDSAGLKAALPAYLKKVGSELGKCWSGAVAIDARHVAPAYPNQARLLGIICQQLASASGLSVVPVITQAMLAEPPTEFSRLLTFSEQIFRVITPFVNADMVKTGLSQLSTYGFSPKSVHLLVDQFSIVNDVPATRLSLTRPFLLEAAGSNYASVTLAGGSFPVNLVGLKQGFHDIQRVEWKIWKLLQASKEFPKVRYADYTVSNPALMPDLPADQVNPSVSVRYTADGFWRVYKAKGFKGGGPNQLKNLCKLLVSDTIYSGAAFSFGDASYDKAAKDPSPDAKNGTPSSWRRDATSHHVAVVQTALGV